MKVSEEFSVAAPAPAVWTALNDLPLVASCLPGAEVLEVDADGTRARGRMNMRLGPIATNFEGEATIERDDESMIAQLDGSGTDRRSSSRAKMHMEYRVQPGGEESVVRIDAEISLSGMLAQFSKGPVVRQVAAQLTREFATSLQSRLAPEPPQNHEGSDTPLLAANSAGGGAAAATMPAPALNPLGLLWRVLLSSSRGALDENGAFSRIGLPVLFAISVFALWEAITRYFEIREVLLPAPSAIWMRLMETWSLLTHHAWSTMWESVTGFIIATVLGVSLAAMLSASRLMRSMLYPNIVLFQLIPKIALAPLFIVWLGISHESRLAFSVFISFFPIVVATLAGLDNVDQSLLRLCKALTASPWQIFTSARLPHALPHVFSGMKIATTFAIIGVIVGEFITSQKGLGYLVLFAAAQADTALILAAITVLCIFGLVFYGLVALLERVVRDRLGA